MIEPTDEMLDAFNDADYSGCGNADWENEHLRIGLAAVLAIIERDYLLGKRLTAEEIEALPKPRRRLRGCVERWPGAEIEGDYDPRCCRFPKSCSASVYDDQHVTDDDLEPER